MHAPKPRCASAIFSLSCALVIASTPEYANAACATVETMFGINWIETDSGQASHLSWSLTQTGNVITGTATAIRNFGSGEDQCPLGETWAIVGTYTGSGTFSLTADYTGSHSGACADFTQTGTMTGVGCNAANITFQTVGKPPGTGQWAHSCYVPTGETAPVVTSYGSTGEAAGAVFDQKLKPTTYDWGGRTISEAFPYSNFDSCWFPGSARPPAVPVAEPPSVLNSEIPTDYEDLFSMTPQMVTYYRGANRTPCATLDTIQDIRMQCPSPEGNVVYINNAAYHGIDPVTVTFQRGPTLDVHVWGPPAPGTYFPTIISHTVLN